MRPNGFCLNVFFWPFRDFHLFYDKVDGSSKFLQDVTGHIFMIRYRQVRCFFRHW